MHVDIQQVLNDATALATQQLYDKTLGHTTYKAIYIISHICDFFLEIKMYRSALKKVGQHNSQSTSIFKKWQLRQHPCICHNIFTTWSPTIRVLLNIGTIIV